MMREFTFLQAALLHYLGYRLFKIQTSTTVADDRYAYEIPELDIEALEKDLANPETQVEYLPFLKAVIKLKRLTAVADEAGGIKYFPVTNEKGS